MNYNRILLVTLMASSLWGCPSDPVVTPDTGTTTPDAGNDAAMPDVDADMPDTGVSFANDCSGYCMATLGACTGAMAQYADMAECMSICNELAWPAGTEGATSGNTIACRIYHASVALGTPAVHCPHTGATGGGVCVGATPVFRADTTGYTRVDRLGMPGVSTALVASARKDAYNDGTPTEDITLTYASDLLGGLTGLHAALDDDLTGMSLVPCSMTMTRDLDGPTGLIPPLPLCAAQFFAPATPVVGLLLPDAIAIDPARPAGFPNGRRLADPVMDVTLAVILLDVETTAGQSALSFVNTTTGGGNLSQNVNDVSFLAEFPYLAAAHAP